MQIVGIFIGHHAVHNLSIENGEKSFDRRINYVGNNFRNTYFL